MTIDRTRSYQLLDVKGNIRTTRKSIVLPFKTVNIQDNTKLKGQCTKIHVLAELDMAQDLLSSVILEA